MDFYEIQYSPIQKPLHSQVHKNLGENQRLVIKKKKIIIYGTRIIKKKK